MKTCGGCGTWIPDGAAVCPSCGRDPGPSAPPPPPSAPSPSPTPPGEAPAPGPAPGIRARAEARVRTLGLLYAILGGAVLLSVLLSFVQFASGSALRDLAEARRDPDLNRLLGEVAGEAFDTIESLYLSPLYLAVVHLVPFCMGVLLLHAGLRLRSLRGRTEAIIAAGLCLVPLPLVGCCCCWLAFPLGVYALVVLTRGDTERALRSRGP